MPWSDGLGPGPRGGIALGPSWVQENSTANQLFDGLEPCLVSRGWERGDYLRYDVVLTPMAAEDVQDLLDKRGPPGSDAWDGDTDPEDGVAAPYGDDDHLGVTIVDVSYDVAARQWRTGALAWVTDAEEALGKAERATVRFANDAGTLVSEAEIEIPYDADRSGMDRVRSFAVSAGFSARGERSWERSRDKWDHLVEIRTSRVELLVRAHGRPPLNPCEPGRSIPPAQD